MSISVTACVSNDIKPSRALDIDDSSQLSEYLVECLHIPTEPGGVKEHLSRCAQDLAFWNKRYAAAIREVGFAEADFRRTEGVLWASFHQKISAIKGKATEAHVKSCVRADPQYILAKQQLHEAEAAVQDLRGTCEAIRGKLFALGSMGNLLRAELGDYAIKTQV